MKIISASGLNYKKNQDLSTASKGTSTVLVPEEKEKESPGNLLDINGKNAQVQFKVIFR